VTRNRYDETWHRLREWTQGHTVSERLAAQILAREGYKDIDPSHPLGGKDDGKDGIANRDGIRFAMAVYFPRGQQSFRDIKTKFESDLEGARRNSAEGIAFITNQELSLAQRARIQAQATPTRTELYHLERITTILDVPDMAKIREQFLSIPATDPTTLNLGGEGGRAPGAGGGGGGVIGHSSTAGGGGPGGNITLSGRPGEAPGAGGGGAGAIGQGAVGGEGGGGGEHLALVLGPNEIGPSSGIHHVEIQVGKGGVNGPGEDTILNFCDEQGRVLRSVVAKGGQQGASSFAVPPSRSPAQADVNAGLRVTGIIAAEFFRFRDQLVTIVDGGWDILKANSNPFRVVLPLLVEIATGAIEPSTILDIKLAVRNPDGFLVHEKVHAITVSDSGVRRSRFGVTLEFSGSQAGLWRVQVLAGEHLIGEFPIEVQAPNAS
jgi:hypothetical protein